MGSRNTNRIAFMALVVCVISTARADESPIDLSLFRDSIGHWNNEHGRDRNDPRLDPSDFMAIADRLAAYQNEDGGWPKNVDWLLNISVDEVRRIKGRSMDRSTFDNRNVYPQVRYLVEAHNRSREERFMESAMRGLEFIVREQRASGGWRGSDVDAITYNDDVMTGVMELLLDLTHGEHPFDRVASERRIIAKASLDRAVDATLRCQIVVGNELTGWCQQHDHETFEPVAARSYELPAICPAETTSIVRLLMKIDSQDDRIARAIDGALRWLEKAALTGIRLERFDIEPVRFPNHTATTDVRVVEDAAASRLWARFYDIETGQPFFCNRDGTRVYALADVALERRTGYGWYGAWPSKLLSEHRRALEQRN